MILRLDKGDTQEVFKEFVDIATRKYIDDKIKKLFDQRVESVVKSKFENIDLEKMFQGKVNQFVNEYFKHHRWNDRCEHIDKIIREELNKINFERLVTKKFSEELLEELWGKIKLVK